MFLVCLVNDYHNRILDLDTEGTIPGDTDPPQEMGDSSVEVSMTTQCVFDSFSLSLLVGYRRNDREITRGEKSSNDGC